MGILGSPARIRLAALIATVVGLVTFVAAQGTSGRVSIVLASISLSLFLLEIILGVTEAVATDREEEVG